MRHLQKNCLLTVTSLCFAISAGCADSGDLAGPTERQLKDVFDVSATVQRVTASSVETCDGKLLFGGVNPGEFQFRSILYRGDSELSIRSTSGYNTVLGTSHELAPKQSVNHTHAASFTGDVGESLVIHFWAAEWDGTSKDSKLNNAQGRKIIDLGPNTRTGSYSVMVSVGNAQSCGLTLETQVRITRRQARA